MRMTKDLAYQVATKMAQGSKQLYEAAKKEYSAAVREAFEKQIPKEVKECYAKHKDWFLTRSIICLHGHGFNWERVVVDSPVISNAEKHSDPTLKLTKELGDSLIKLKRKADKLEQDNENLYRETEQALLTLGTFNRIRENLPEAAPFLPPPMSNALVVNFDSLRKRLEKQPEVQEHAKLKKQYAAVIVKK